MTRIYVGGIPTDCRERDLDKFFRNYGRLRDCLIKNGYAFVEFEDNRDADDAVYEMNGRELLGCRVSVEHARGIPRRGEHMGQRRQPSWTDRSDKNRPGGRNVAPGYGPPSNARYGPPMRTPYRVIVENLSSRISWQDLKDYMRKEADVTFADAHRHARNEGIVEFASYSDMKRAIDRLDDTDLMGRRIKMIDDYKRSRSRSRHRSRSRSRSKRRHSYSSSRSRSRSKRRSRSRSRSRRDRSRSRSRSHSRDSKRSRSRSEAKENSKSRSLSPSIKKDEVEKSNGSNDQNGKRSRSRSRSRSQSRPRSHGGSPSPKKARTSRSRSNSNGRERSRSRSYRSRSRSGERNDD